MNERNTTGGGVTVGLDLGDRYSEGCVVDGSGEVVETFRVRTTEPALGKRLSSFPRAAW